MGDLCACLTSWFQYEYGDPARTVWRCGDFDLSDNDLTDESVCQVIDYLRRHDVRVRRLRLQGNRIQPRALDRVTQYVWDCQEPLAEIDVSWNLIDADPGDPKGDPVSTLLRCVYNHFAYPKKVKPQYGDQVEIMPLVLQVEGNFVLRPALLLRNIDKKGGTHRVRFTLQPVPFLQLMT